MNVIMPIVFFVIVGGVAFVVLRMKSPSTAGRVADFAKAAVLGIGAAIADLWDKVF